jgi:hypothetical protein
MRDGSKVQALVIACAAAMFAISSTLTASEGQGVEPVKKNSAAGDLRQGFSVVLLLGDAQGPDSQDTLSQGARKALLDVKDFLPYKGYRLLDTHWMLCCSGSTPTITRVRGLDEQDYELQLQPIPPGPPVSDGAYRLGIRFVLREPPEIRSVAPSSKTDFDRSRDGEIFQLEREQVDLQAQVTSLKKGVEVGIKDPAELTRVQMLLAQVNNRLTAIRNASGSGKTDGRIVIDTSFRMDVGETVVVGTSRLKGGNRALIALLTAVAPRSKTDTALPSTKR